MINKKKVGYIVVTNQFLEDFWLQNNWVVPLRIIPQVHMDTVKYLVYCKDFRELKELEKIPSYNLIFTKKVEEIEEKKDD